MAITIDYGNTYIINIELSDLTLVSGTTYSFDTDVFRRRLKDLEDDSEGIPFPRTHRHNTEVSVAGTTFARTIEILAPYSVQFPDLQISILLQGSNNNIFDVGGGILVRNNAQIISGNSAGLIVDDNNVVVSGGAESCCADLTLDLIPLSLVADLGKSTRTLDIENRLSIDLPQRPLSLTQENKLVLDLGGR